MGHQWQCCCAKAWTTVAEDRFKGLAQETGQFQTKGAKTATHSSRSQHSTAPRDWQAAQIFPLPLSHSFSLNMQKQNGRTEREEHCLRFRAQPPYFSCRQFQVNSSELELSLNLLQIKYNLCGGFCKQQAHGKMETSVWKIYRSGIRRRLQLPIPLLCKQQKLSSSRYTYLLCTADTQRQVSQYKRQHMLSPLFGPEAVLVWHRLLNMRLLLLWDKITAFWSYCSLKDLWAWKTKRLHSVIQTF